MNKIIFGIIGVTYRCNAKCTMCETWKFPTKREEEIKPSVIEKLPFMNAVNVTGGEPTIREDLDDIITLLEKKSNRIVLSTNGFSPDRILSLVQKHPNLGVRISMEGFSKSNYNIRKIPNGFDKALKTLLRLKDIGSKDVGFGITVSNENIDDLMDMYRLAKTCKLEFATATIHNSYYFHKHDNKFEDKDKAIKAFGSLVEAQLKSKKPKDWFRAYFNYGIINHIKGSARLFCCRMGHNSFYLDPHGDIRACNVLESSMGNLNDRSFEDIWESKEAAKIRDDVLSCQKNCWMIGSVGEMMKRKIWKPLIWIGKHKFLKNDLGI